MNRASRDWLEEEFKRQDKTCVYCGVQMIEKAPPGGPRKATQTVLEQAELLRSEWALV